MRTLLLIILFRVCVLPPFVVIVMIPVLDPLLSFPDYCSPLLIVLSDSYVLLFVLVFLLLALSYCFYALIVLLLLIVLLGLLPSTG